MFIKFFKTMRFITVLIFAVSLLAANGYGQNDWWTGGYRIALDSANNVYVGGYCSNTGTQTDFLIIKYDSTGQQLWVANYDGPVHGEDWLQAIALDASGNVYVTGTSAGTYDVDYATVKYNPSGKRLWAARYNGPGNSYDYAYDIDVDVFGNVYMTGHSQGIGTGDDIATIKYDSDGNEVWVRRYSTPDSECGFALDLDSSRNIYVTGRTRYGTVIKYDSAGNELNVFSGCSVGDSFAFGLELDSSGNIILAGFFGQSLYITAKYDSGGNLSWERWYGSFGGVQSATAPSTSTLVLDQGGNAYVTGLVDLVAPNYGDYGTVKYDPLGNLLWEARYNGPGNGTDYAQAVALDGSGNVCVNGYSKGNGTANDFDYATVKYDTFGYELWVARYNGPASYFDTGYDVKADAAGNTYVTGESTVLYPPWDTECVTIKYDSSGNVLWMAKYSSKRNTQPGENVIVQPIDPATGQAPVTLTFGSIVEGGTTALTMEPTGTPPPGGFKIGEPPIYYVLETTAVYSGPVTVCFNYTGVSYGNEGSLRIFHNYNGHWEDITSSLDTANKIICGQTLSFSEFAIFEIDVEAEGFQEPLAALVPADEDPPIPDVAFKQGRTLPLKLQLLSAGRMLTSADVAPPKIVSVVREGTPIPLETVDLDSGQANDSGPYFRYSDGSWIYNLGTKSLMKGTYRITLLLPDGDLVCAGFVLR